MPDLQCCVVNPAFYYEIALKRLEKKNDRRLLAVIFLDGCFLRLEKFVTDLI